MPKGFAESVRQWTKEAKDKNNRILQEAIRLLLAEVIDAMPKEDGNLSNSVRVGFDGVQPVDRDNRATYADPSGPNAAALMQVEAGKPVYISVTAPYALRANYGFTGQDALGRFFNNRGAFYIQIGEAKWNGFVRKAAANV
jgi:hypothetical protein